MKPKILILTPFQNESHSIPFYLSALRNLDYPRELISVLWFENDSSDETYGMLEEAVAEFSTLFKDFEFKATWIHGPISKGVAGNYKKHTPHPPGILSKTWNVIWNDYFIPAAKKCDAEYVLTWFADVIPPPHVINEYLKVFDLKNDAGWVGGRCRRRMPLQNNFCSPFPREARFSREVKEVIITAHCWMNPREALIKTRLR